MAANPLAQVPKVRQIIQQDAETLADGLRLPLGPTIGATERINEWLLTGTYLTMADYDRWRRCIRAALRIQLSKNRPPLAFGTLNVANALYLQ